MLHAAERKLRAYDKALRLRVSLLRPDTLLVERKTFRGRIGRVLPGGEAYDKDSGRRREEGHVLVAYCPLRGFDSAVLLDELKKKDTWYRKPLWQRVEEQEAFEKAMRQGSRESDLRARGASVWDRYVWNTGSRVSMGGYGY